MRNPYEEQDAVQDAARIDRAVAGFRKNFEDLRERLCYTEEGYYETVAEHRSETAMFGDSWPGAQITIRRMWGGVCELRAKVAKAEANKLFPLAFPEEAKERRRRQVGYLIGIEGIPF